MALVLTIIMISVHTIFLAKREILFDKRKFKILLTISLVLVGLYYIIKGLDIYIKSIEGLLVPFFALLVFLVMTTIYRKIFEQDAKDSFHSMDLKLMKDGIFNFLFWVIGLLLPIFLAFEVFGQK
jgi:hypothetical protein